MKTIFITSFQHYPAREYLIQLKEAGIKPDSLVIVGDRPVDAITRIELARTGGTWEPPSLAEILDDYDLKTYFFKKTNSKNLKAFLEREKPDVVVPVDAGILKQDILSLAKIGFINVHPGKLPEFRGCSTPEWQILKLGKCFLTAHLMDTGIDSGPVICIDEMEIKPYWDYNDFRAQMYQYCGKTLVRALRLLEEKGTSVLKPQNEKDSQYWQPMNQLDDLAKVKDFFRK